MKEIKKKNNKEKSIKNQHEKKEVVHCDSFFLIDKNLIIKSGC